MCGIYGFRVREGNTLTPYESSVLCTILAKDMESRGRDSWGGVIFPDENIEHISIHKGVGRVTSGASEFLRMASTARSILAHTRAATVGKVSKENSHPFLIGNVLGVHNGSIYNYEELNKQYARDFEVDSQQIFAHINDELPLTEIEGHGTFFFSRKDEGWKNIYLARTVGGSLCLSRFYRTRDHNKNEFFATVWASEKHAVELAANLIGAYYAEVDIKPKHLYFIGRDGEIYDGSKEFEITASNYINCYRTPTHNCTGNTSGSTYWNDFTADPTISGLIIVPGALTCDKCTCLLSLHKHGKCGDNTKGKCKTTLNDKCLSEFYKICRACGCYLVHGVHTVTEGKVACTGCKRQCSYDTTTNTSGKTTVQDAEIVEEEDELATILQFFGKNARKKMAKKARKLAGKSGRVVEPIPKNIIPIGSVPKYFKNDDTKIPVPLCKDCVCDLSEHMHGWCTNSGSTSCKVKKAICDNGLSVCKDCGCHMVEGIHTEATFIDGNDNPAPAVWCIVCGNYCCTSEDIEVVEDSSESMALVTFNAHEREQGSII